MKEYFNEIISKIKRFSNKLDDLAMLKDKSWVLVNNVSPTKKVFIFQSYNKLIISENGLVEKAQWEYLSSVDALLLDLNDASYLFKHGFVNKDVLALKLDGSEEYFIFEREYSERKDVLRVSGRSPKMLGAVSSASKQERDYSNLRYKILNETSGWGGRFIEYEVLIDFTLRGKFMYSKDDNVFYHSEVKPLIYFDKKEDCIGSLKRSLERKH